jgi:hypothetical protein
MGLDRAPHVDEPRQPSQQLRHRQTKYHRYEYAEIFEHALLFGNYRRTRANRQNATASRIR